MKDKDPFSGPLARITGRLQKLRDHNDNLRSPDTGDRETADGILFELGMLVDLLDSLAWEVAHMLHPDHDCSTHGW
jgi:hypothetical protein